MATSHPQPFAYEDLMESSIQSVIARNNQFDPTGKLNDLRIPPRRLQQQNCRPKWYKPEQHATAPYISASITGPAWATASVTQGSNYPITVTLRHNVNPTGNPEGKPVTFTMKDTALTRINSTKPYPWLLLHHDPSAHEGGLKEIEGEAEDEGHGPAEPWEGNDAPPEQQQPQEVSAENGFVSLAVGESKVFEVVFKPTVGLVKVGERYSLCFRGTFIEWWRWGGLEELRGERKGKVEKGTPRMIVPASNVIEFTIAGEGE